MKLIPYGGLINSAVMAIKQGTISIWKGFCELLDEKLLQSAIFCLF